jgi:D-glycero-D-manno-heptose 1,7-bisphosphate phosphatase
MTAAAFGAKPAGFPALFLDRDGVVIENRADYVRSWDDVAILPGVTQALSRVRETPFRIVLVTNQSAVGRGLITLTEAQEINSRLQRALADDGIQIEGIFLCPHRPEDGCNCRKPKPGLILLAAGSLGIELRASVLIGDAVSDLQAALAAGVGTVAMVRTGRGQGQEALLVQEGLASRPVFDTLAQAVEALLFP